MAGERLQFLFRPRFAAASVLPVDARAGYETGVRALVEAWTQVFPGARPDPALDFEDWCENAAQLQAALAQADRLEIFTQQGRADPVSIDGGGKQFDPERPFMLGGGQLWRGDFVSTSTSARFPNRAEYAAAQAYACNPGFERHARRRTALCAYDDGDGGVTPEENLVPMLGRWRDAGVREVVVKLTEVKRGIAVVPLAELGNAGIEKALTERFDWTMVEMAGRRQAFLVQERVPMEHEYRIFVVDGQPVAGAACIEEFTPLDGQGLRFDQRTRQHRGTFGAAKCAVAPAPEVVARYEQAAQAIVDDLRAGDPRLATFVMDLYTRQGTTEVGLVELNPLRNCGLYAADYARVLRAALQVFELEAAPSRLRRATP